MINTDRLDYRVLNPIEQINQCNMRAEELLLQAKSKPVWDASAFTDLAWAESEVRVAKTIYELAVGIGTASVFVKTPRI